MSGTNRHSESDTANATTETISLSLAQQNKGLNICSIEGMLDLTRLWSFQSRDIFRGAAEDVELIREYLTEAMYNGGLEAGLSNLSDLSKTLDWKARARYYGPTVDGNNLSSSDTTLTAGLGYTDDRPDRRVEKHVSTGPNMPLVGDKQSDMEALDTLSNLLPWLLDRRKCREGSWHRDHQDGQLVASSCSHATDNKEPPLSDLDGIYRAAWMVSMGDATIYYPPLNKPGEPLTLGDILGGSYDGREIWTRNKPVLPANNPNRRTILVNPYADVFHPGLSMISAMAPVFYTGMWKGHTYNDTLVGTAGLDITLDSVASFLDDLEDSLTEGSFALLADTKTFGVIAISQSVVDMIYPARTGLEEERVSRHPADGTILEDRRNQTYRVSDTIWQSLLQGLTSADWPSLHQVVNSMAPGERGHMILDMTLSGSHSPLSYYVTFDRWEYVTDWVLLVFAPKNAVDAAIKPILLEKSVDLKAQKGEEAQGRILLTNEGTLDIVVATRDKRMPSWVSLTGTSGWGNGGGGGQILAAGESIAFEFVVSTDGLDSGTSSTPIVFHISDDGDPNCFHSEEISFEVSLQVTPVPEYHWLEPGARITGLALASLMVLASIGCAFWLFRNRKARAVKASQPLFLRTICGGCLVMGTAIVPLVIDDSIASERGCNIACMATPWLSSMGFTITFAALFSKIWRTNRIFQAGYEKIKVSERDVLVPFVVLFCLSFIVLLAWTFVDPLRWVRHTTMNGWQSYGSCHAEGQAYIAFVVIIVLIDLSALVLALTQAYHARSISDEYSETRFIAIAVAGWLQALIVGLPLIFLVESNPTAAFFVESGLIFAVSMSTLVLIFVPKIVYVKKYKQRREKKKAAELARIVKRASTNIPARRRSSLLAQLAQLDGNELESLSVEREERWKNMHPESEISSLEREKRWKNRSNINDNFSQCSESSTVTDGIPVWGTRPRMRCSFSKLQLENLELKNRLVQLEEALSRHGIHMEENLEVPAQLSVTEFDVDDIIDDVDLREAAPELVKRVSFGKNITLVVDDDEKDICSSL